MRRFLVSAALAVVLAATGAGPVAAAPAAPPPAPAPSSGWSSANGQLVWRADRPVPRGAAAVEFWSGGQLLGRARPEPDGRTFTMPLPLAYDLGDLAVRAGGRRLDRAAVSGSRKAAPVVTAPAPLPANPVDPGVRGPFAAVRGEYTLDPLAVPGLPEKVEMQAVVVAPAGATGKRPLALFLHGMHSVCYNGAEEGPFEWPCPAGTAPVPSYRGYLQSQELLASQGYVTVSISANGINGQGFDSQDYGAQARSTLVRAHLAKWAGWARETRSQAPAIVRSTAPADLSKVLLVGHSRGGEGVSRAATDTVAPPLGDREPVRWTIRGLLLIGPTVFGHNPVPDVPSASILPGCDGDVFDLQGQMYVDATRGVSTGRALHSSLYMLGANHNFFNTEWTPGQSAAPSWDDSISTDEPSEPVCSPGRGIRLTAQQQQTAGATYIAAAARLFVAGDDRVRPLLDGTGKRAPSAGPARVLSHALGGRRTPVLAADASLRVSGGGGRLCQQVTPDQDRTCLPLDTWWPYLVHFAALSPIIPEPDRYAAVLDWRTPGTPVRFTPPRPADVRGSQSLALRLMVAPNTTGNRFEVAVTGRDGRRTTLGEVGVDGLPGTGNTNPYWAQEVRVPLRGVRDIASVELIPRSAAGRAWLLDAWGWSPGTPDPGPAALPRVDIGEIGAVEGDTGVRTYRVPVTVTGKGQGVVRFHLRDSLQRTIRSWTAPVRPGDRSLRVSVPVPGDELFAAGEQHTLLARAERGVLIGDYRGGVEVINDDPEPTVTVDATTVRTAEGGTLTWQLRLSAPAESPTILAAYARAPVAGAELSSTDVDPLWFQENAYEPAEPSRPLSQTELSLFGDFGPGQTTTTVTVPTVTDDLTEPDETAEFVFAREGLPTLTGVVTGG